jgi:hypothetical protein
MTRNLLWFVKSLIVALLVIFVSSAWAQYVSQDDLKKQNEAKKESKLIAALDALRGKTFWIRPNPKAILRVEFLEAPLFGAAKFFVTTETSFVVIDYDKQDNYGNYYYYLKLEFPDGKVGFLKSNGSASSDPDEYPLIEQLYTGKDTFYDFKEYIFPKPPQEMLDAKKAKQAKGKSVGQTSSVAYILPKGKPIYTSQFQMESSASLSKEAFSGWFDDQVKTGQIIFAPIDIPVVIIDECSWCSGYSVRVSATNGNFKGWVYKDNLKTVKKGK